MHPRPAWRLSLESALFQQNDQAHSRYAQLSTVTVEGRPANRTIVFRSFFDPEDRLLFSADARSHKASHLAANPWAELCWYFTQSREQFRLFGSASVISEDDRNPQLAAARVRVWEALPTNSRQTFSWPAPGEKRASAEAFQHPAPANPPPNFGLIVLKPKRVERLDLTKHPHERILYRLAEDAGWSRELLNP